MNSAAFLPVLQQLPTGKSRQIRRLGDRQTQLQSIIGLALVKSGLQQLGLRKFHLKKIRFQNNKPYVRQGSYFSISHSKQCICCVVSKTHSVGIDVEKDRPLTESLIKKYHLTGNHSDKNNAGAIMVWTQKEAVLKVCANNKLSELKQVVIEQNKAHFKKHCYRLKSFSLPQKYTMSIASTQAITKLKIKRVYF